MMISRYFGNLWEEAKQQRKKDIVSFIDIRGKEVKLLDCGCDDGKYTVQFGKLIGTKYIYGAEIVENAIKQAKKREIRVVKCDLNKKIPFKAGQFDLITADQVIEHLWDLDAFLSELKRILKVGGFAVISTENLAGWHNVFALCLGWQPFVGPTPSKYFQIGYHPGSSIQSGNRLKEKDIMPPHTKVLTFTALSSLFKLYGFEILGTKTRGYPPFNSFIGKFLSSVDKRHSLFMTFKIRRII